MSPPDHDPNLRAAFIRRWPSTTVPSLRASTGKFSGGVSPSMYADPQSCTLCSSRDVHGLGCGGFCVSVNAARITAGIVDHRAGCHPAAAFRRKNTHTDSADAPVAESRAASATQSGTTIAHS